MAKPKPITRAQFQAGIKFYIGDQDKFIYQYEGLLLFNELAPIIVTDDNRYHCSALDITDTGFTGKGAVLNKTYSNPIKFKKCFIAENQ